MTAASAAASSLVTALPDDIATPVAEKIADLGVVLGAIVMVLLAEKYLMPLTACVGIVLLFVAVSVLLLSKDKAQCKNFVIKMTALALTLILAIPTGVLASDMIDKIFSDSINKTLDDAIQQGNFAVAETGGKKLQDDRNIFQKGWDAITVFFGSFIDKIVQSVNKTVNIAKNMFGTFVEATAILIVTNCLIPILTLIIYLRILKFVFNWDFRDNAYYKTMRKRVYKHFHHR